MCAHRVLVLDDDADVRGFLTSLIADADVDACGTVAAARESILSARYDGWILDVVLPDGSGLDLLGWARAEGLTTPALVLTADGQLAHANRAQLLSATIAYKPDVESNVRAFVASVTGGLSAEDTGRLDAHARRARLSRRERDVLVEFARGRSRAGAGAALAMGENTVKTIVRRLLAKTGHARVQDLVDAWRWAEPAPQPEPPPEPVKASGVRKRISARASARPSTAPTNRPVAASTAPPPEPGATLVPPARVARQRRAAAEAAAKRRRKRSG